MDARLRIHEELLTLGDDPLEILVVVVVMLADMGDILFNILVTLDNTALCDVSCSLL